MSKRDSKLIDAIQEICTNSIAVTKITIETMGGTPEVIFKEALPK